MAFLNWINKKSNRDVMNRCIIMSGVVALLQMVSLSAAQQAPVLPVTKKDATEQLIPGREQSPYDVHYSGIVCQKVEDVCTYLESSVGSCTCTVLAGYGLCFLGVCADGCVHRGCAFSLVMLGSFFAQGGGFIIKDFCPAVQHYFNIYQTRSETEKRKKKFLKYR